jgi:hypothetical protein
LRGRPLRWCVVRQTPTYDQLRGERINADVPASDVDPDWLDRPGRHRLGDDTSAAAAIYSPPPRPRGEQAEEWSGFGTGGIDDRPGKHRLHDHAPAAAAACGQSRGPATDRAEGWSWFGTTKEPGRADLANATPTVPCSAGTHCPGHTPAVDQRPQSDHRAVGQPTPRASVPPPVHARESQQPGAVDALAATRAPTRANLCPPHNPAEPGYDSQSLDSSPSASISTAVTSVGVTSHAPQPT